VQSDINQPTFQRCLLPP